VSESRRSGTRDIDRTQGPAFIPRMAAKSFHDMSLDEVFDLELNHSFNLGRRVVSESGFKRHQTKQAKMVRGLLGSKKRRKPSLA